MKQKLFFQLLLLCSFIFSATAADNTLNLDNAGVVTYTELNSTDVTVSGKTGLHLTSSTPLTNSTVDLQSGDSWIYLDAVKPSVAITRYIKTKTITFNGDSIVLKLGADNDNSKQNARIAIYGQGSVIIPNGNLSDNDALQVFTEPDFGGNSNYYAIYTRYTSLGAFNNAIRSFILKKGYMATLANQIDGTGFSKVFIADTADLKMNVMPKGLEKTVSFIRVMRWDWNSQKGWAGGGADVALTNSTSFYDWNVGGDVTSPDYNYVTIKQKLNWPSSTDIQNKKNVNHLLGLNEPDHSEQHEDDNGGKPVTVAQAINLMPGMMASGFRVGSPAPTDFSWLYNFIAECDKRNYRVDFVAIHAYWATSTSSWRSQLQAVWNNTKRPIWITEWNNGANWTTETTWPNSDRSYTTANAQKQLTDIKNIIGVMEEPASHVERYFIYNWVQDARAMELNGSLTLAGAWYADNLSKLAYTSAYDHQWKLVVPDFNYKASTTDPSQYIFSWKDYNRETAIGYVLEKYVTGGAWSAVGDTIPAIHTDAGVSSDDAVPVLTTTDILTQSSYYRIKAIGYDGSLANSAVIQIIQNAQAPAPVVTATIISSSWINLKWNTVANATAYKVYRASYPDSIYSVLRNSFTGSNYDDTFGLTPNTVYWYKVTSLNNNGESTDAVPVKAITNKENGDLGDDPTSINTVMAKDFNLYPNPVKAGQPIFVEDNDATGKLSVEIMDMTGKIVFQFKDNQSVFAPQTKGIYFLKLSTQQQTKIYKLIVN